MADLGVKVDANGAAINALGQQAAGRFTQFEQRIDRFEDNVASGFADMRGRFDQTAAGQEMIVNLLNTIIESPDTP